MRDPAEPVEIISVTTSAQLRQFVDLPGQLCVSDPNFIVPLRMERLEAFSPAKNSFMRRAEVRFWLALKNGKPVGRISAQIDPLAVADAKEGVGQFGCLVASDDRAVVGALLAAAEGFLKSRGKPIARGPFTLSVNEETGLLIDGFDTPPMVMMGHDPAYLGSHLDGCGYVKARDVYAYLLDLLAPPTPFFKKVIEQTPGTGMTIRRFDFTDYAGEIARLVSIFNDAWQDNWAFVPLTEEETQELAARIRPIIDPRLGWFAEFDGEPVAFILGLPDLNEAIRDIGGRLFPIGWAKLLWRLKVQGVRSLRVPLMGVRRRLHASTAGAAAPLLLIGALMRKSLELGYAKAELSWILEDNRAMRRILESIGATPYKTYRVYEKRLA